VAARAGWGCSRWCSRSTVGVAIIFPLRVLAAACCSVSTGTAVASLRVAFLVESDGRLGRHVAWRLTAWCASPFALRPLLPRLPVYCNTTSDRVNSMVRDTAMKKPPMLGPRYTIFQVQTASRQRPDSVQTVSRQCPDNVQTAKSERLDSYTDSNST